MRLAPVRDSALVVIDLQPSFLKVVPNAEATVRRSEFIIRIAKILEVPVLLTEQNPVRMGGTEPTIIEAVGGEAIAKLAFGCCGEIRFSEAWTALGRSAAVVVGIETHICVTQTALALRDQGTSVFLPVDAVASRHQQGHEVALRRLESNGVQLTHTESVVYEWLGSANHPRFREALEIVKAYPVC